MKITDIYKKYDIMPSLQLHQFRVAAVASQVCKSLNIEIDEHAIVISCLLHDMGNIIKFKLDYFPEFSQPEGIEYWQKIQQEYTERYGKDEHKATLAIAKELNIDDKILRNIDSVGFSNLCNVYSKGSLEEKICVYADFRVSPQGVVSVTERLEEGYKRYKGLNSEIDENRNMLNACIYNIEKEIFLSSKIKPEDINDTSSATSIELFKNFEI